MESKEEIKEHSSVTESAAEDAETVAATVAVDVDKSESQVRPIELYHFRNRIAPIALMCSVVHEKLHKVLHMITF